MWIPKAEEGWLFKGWGRAEVADAIIQQDRGAEGKAGKENKEEEAVGVEGLSKW